MGLLSLRSWLLRRSKFAVVSNTWSRWLIAGYSARTESVRSRSLGWKPHKTDEDFKNHLQTEVEKMMEGKEKGK